MVSGSSWRVRASRPSEPPLSGAGRFTNYALRATAGTASKRSVASLNGPLTMLGGTLAARISSSSKTRRIGVTTTSTAIEPRSTAIPGLFSAGLPRH